MYRGAFSSYGISVDNLQNINAKKMAQKAQDKDQLLVTSLIANNEQGFRALFDRYHQDIYRYALSLLKVNELAEEVVQDVFLKIWQNREQLDPAFSFKSYLFTIAKHRCLNMLRKAAHDKKLREQVFYKKQHTNTTEDYISDTEYEKIKAQAISQLPPKRKLIFEMSRNDGKSYEDISTELGISVSTVKTQMSKALETIRHFLRANGDITITVAYLIIC